MKVKAHFTDDEVGLAVMMDKKEAMAFVSLQGWADLGAAKAYIQQSEEAHRKEERDRPNYKFVEHPDPAELAKFMDQFLSAMWYPLWNKLTEESRKAAQADPTKAEDDDDY